jgi:hypothetical protein
MPETKAIANPRCDSHDVLHRAAHLDAGQIVVGVNA